MYTSPQKVINTRLNMELNLHVVNGNYTVNSNNKTIFGNILSFKSDKVVDAFNELGNLQPALVTPFAINADSLSNIDKTVSDYLKDNLEALVSR